MIHFDSIEFVSIVIDSIGTVYLLVEFDRIRSNSLKPCHRFDQIGFIDWSNVIGFDQIRSTVIELYYPIRFGRIGFRWNRFDRKVFIHRLSSIEFDPIREPKSAKGSHNYVWGSIWVHIGSHLEVFWEPLDKIVSIGDLAQRNLNSHRVLYDWGPIWEHFGCHVGSFQSIGDIVGNHFDFQCICMSLDSSGGEANVLSLQCNGVMRSRISRK